MPAWRANATCSRATSTASPRCREADFRRWPKDERLAFLINAYNAWTVELVLTAWPKLDSIKDLGSLFASPWKKALHPAARSNPLAGRHRARDDPRQGRLRRAAHPLRRQLRQRRLPRPAPRGLHRRKARRPACGRDPALPRRSHPQSPGWTVRSRSPASSSGMASDFERTGGLRAFLADQGEALGLSAAQRRSLRDGSLKIVFLDYSWRLNGGP